MAQRADCTTRETLHARVYSTVLYSTVSHLRRHPSSHGSTTPPVDPGSTWIGAAARCSFDASLQRHCRRCIHSSPLAFWPLQWIRRDECPLLTDLLDAAYSTPEGSDGPMMMSDDLTAFSNSSATPVCRMAEKARIDRCARADAGRDELGEPANHESRGREKRPGAGASRKDPC